MFGRGRAQSVAEPQNYENSAIYRPVLCTLRLSRVRQDDASCLMTYRPTRITFGIENRYTRNRIS